MPIPFVGRSKSRGQRSIGGAGSVGREFVDPMYGPPSPTYTKITDQANRSLYGPYPDSNTKYDQVMRAHYGIKGNEVVLPYDAKHVKEDDPNRWDLTKTYQVHPTDDIFGYDRVTSDNGAVEHERRPAQGQNNTGNPLGLANTGKGIRGYLGGIRRSNERNSARNSQDNAIQKLADIVDNGGM